MKIFLQPGESGVACRKVSALKTGTMASFGTLTDVGAVDEAEKVEKSNGRNDVKVDLPSKFALSLFIKRDERVPISKHGTSVTWLNMLGVDVLVGRDMSSLSGFMEVLAMHRSCLLILKRLSEGGIDLLLLHVVVFGSHDGQIWELKAFVSTVETELTLRGVAGSK